jgi:hypothetical protein
VFDKMKALVSGQVGDVIHTAGAQIVHSDDLVAISHQVIAEMGPDEPGSAGDENTHFPP